MPEDWFEVAYINFDEAILYGRRADHSEVRVVLDDEQKRAVEKLNTAHQLAMEKLLRGFAGTSPDLAQEGER